MRFAPVVDDAEAMRRVDLAEFNLDRLVGVGLGVHRQEVKRAAARLPLLLVDDPDLAEAQGVGSLGKPVVEPAFVAAERSQTRQRAGEKGRTWGARPCHLLECARTVSIAAPIRATIFFPRRSNPSSAMTSVIRSS